MLEVAQRFVPTADGRAGASVMLGTLFLRAGQLDDARSAYMLAIKDGNKYVVENASVNLGLISFTHDEEMDDAVNWFRGALDSSDAEFRWTARQYTGKALRSLNKWDEAVIILNSALQAAPDQEKEGESLRELSAGLIALGRLKEAEPYLERLRDLRKHKLSPYASYDLGVMWLRRGDHSHAQQLFLEASQSSSPIAADARAALLRHKDLWPAPDAPDT